MDQVIPQTGEKLPSYDDEPAVNAHTLRSWLIEHVPQRWSDAEGVIADGAEREIITDVIGALQVAGDATTVKNATYRALLRDRAAVERLAAGLTRLGLTAWVLEADGDPITAALQALADGTSQSIPPTD